MNAVYEILNRRSQFKDLQEFEGKLAALGSSAIPDLVSVVQNDDENYIYATDVLVKIGDPAAVEPLFQEFCRRIWKKKYSITAALAKLVDSAHAVLFLNLIQETKDTSLRDDAAFIIGTLAGKGVDASLNDCIVGLLLKIFGEEKDSIHRRDLLNALGASKDPRVLDTLLSEIEKYPNEVSKGLGNFNDDRAVDALMAHLMGSTGKANQTNIDSLGRIGNRRAVVPILEVLKNNNDEGSHKAAAIALGKLGDISAVDALINCLMTENDPGTRKEAANSLGLLHDRQAIDALKKAQKDKEDYVRDAATKALALMDIHEAPPEVIEPPKIQGILVLSYRELANKSDLLWEIAIQQRKLGYENAHGYKEVVSTVGDNLNDQAYTYASIRSDFSAFGGPDLIDRAYSYDFKSSDGNYGKYYIIFTKPK